MTLEKLGEAHGGRRSSKRKLLHNNATTPSNSALRGGQFNQRNKSIFQYHLEHALDKTSAYGKVLHLVETATNDDINDINSSNWTPLVGIIFCLGSSSATAKGNTTKSEEQLLQFVRVCQNRGILPNSIAWFGGNYHRPLTVAAYYGYHSAVQLLINYGALPDLVDGRGHNTLHNAFQCPVGSNTRRMRECDQRTVMVLIELGVVTSDVQLWKNSPVGTMCYVNDEQSQQPPYRRSLLSRALEDKNVDAVKLIVNNAGAMITDRDYLCIRCHGLATLKSRLLNMVSKVIAADNNCEQTTRSDLSQGVKSWNHLIDWSFPPTWKVGVALCRNNCGLPSTIFLSHVVPYLDRDWFYDASQLKKRHYANFISPRR